LSLIEHPQVQNASPPIGCLKELLNYHWLRFKTCAEIENMLCPTWAVFRCSQTNCVFFRCGYLAS
jgi:hypothetical protein